MPTVAVVTYSNVVGEGTLATYQFPFAFTCEVFTTKRGAPGCNPCGKPVVTVIVELVATASVVNVA